MSTEDATRSPGDPEHARLRELLGAYALGHLERDDPSATAAVRAHLDGCTSCRADLAEITPLVVLLDGVSPAAFGSPPFPPPELGDRIRDAVAGERPRQPTTIRPRRHRGGGSSRSRWLEVAAAAAVVVAVGAGAVVGRSSAPEAPAAAPVPLQPVTLRAVGDTGLEVRSAGVVAHTWGVRAADGGLGLRPGRGLPRSRAGHLRRP